MIVHKILLVEDDPDEQRMFNIFLRARKDITFLPPLEGGPQLLNVLDSLLKGGALPDLIIMDQNMPHMTGKQILKLLKGRQDLKHIPVFIYSTYADDKLITECENIGALKVTSKPIDKEGYEQMINDFLSLIKRSAH